MTRVAPPCIAAVLLCLTCTLSLASQAQLAAGPGITDSIIDQVASTRTISFSGTLPGQVDGSLSITFFIYSDQQGQAALWSETQIVQVASEKYTVMLGSTSPTGLPQDLFAADQAHWLGVEVNGTEKRFLLVSVPYAMKAVEAERLGGLLPTDFVTVAQLQSLLQSSATSPAGSQPTAPGKTTGVQPQEVPAGTPAQPATDFTDNNASEVLLVTQQGTGFAIHAITSSQAETIFAENSSIGGTAFHAFASNQTTGQIGPAIGTLSEVASADGIAGVFNNRAGGKILSLRSNNGEVASADSNGNLTANGQIQAGNFVGSGAGLTNISPSAINATPNLVPNTVVSRDGLGNFGGNFISANTFFGDGSGLLNIPPGAINATPNLVPNTVVSRDGLGNFGGNFISAKTFFGDGSGLLNIPPGAINATPNLVPNTVVSRDGLGNFGGNFISAKTFFGDGSGLLNIPPGAINATPNLVPNTVVQRDDLGNFGGNFISAKTFFGDGSGLLNIPAGAINASPNNVANSVVQRDGTGSFQAGSLTLSGNADFTAATSTAPVKAVLSINTPTTCQASKDLLIKTDAPAGQQLFICNPTSDGYVLVGDGNSAGTGGTTSGVTSVSAGDSSIAIGGTSSSPTIAVANGGITSAKLAPNAVTSANISDGSLTPAKITGTAATLSGNNVFLGQQTFLGTEIVANLNVAAISGNSASFLSDLGSGGALYTTYPGSGTLVNGLVKLLTNGTATATATDITDANGVIGIALDAPDSSGNIQIAYSGRARCVFDQTTGLPVPGDFFGISHLQRGECRDLGTTITPGNGQVLGRILAGGQSGSPLAPVLLVQTQDGSQTPVSINTGAGLAGGPITSSGTVSIANNGVTNAMLQNSFLFVNSGTGLSGGGPIQLGGSLTLNNTGVLSFNGRTGNIAAAPGDYSFNQIGGALASTQLPATTVYSDQSNTFTTNQTFQGNVTASGALSANTVSAGISTFSGTASLPLSPSVLTVADNGTSGVAALSVLSTNDPVASFLSSGPTIFTAGTITGATTVLSTNGDLRLSGTATARAFSGDGSALTNVNAVKLGTLGPADVATNASLSSETTARQSADSTIQTNINTETSARQSADTSLQNNINAEAAARASADSALQANINAVSAAAVQLSAANTFTAKQTLAASTASAASLNIPTGIAPATPTAGDVWNTGTTVQFRDTSSNTRSLVSTTQSGGLQLLKLTASITPSVVNSQLCAEQTFSVSGIAPGDVILNVLQPSTSSPGTNIGIGSFRVTTANSVIISFCNVGKNNATPTAGTYTFALMR